MVLGNALLQEMDILTGEDIACGARERGFRVFRFFLESDDPLLCVNLHDAVLLRRALGIADVEDGNSRSPFGTEKLLEVTETELEEIVPGNDEHLIIDLCMPYGEVDIADGPEAILIARRAVIEDGELSLGR